MSTTLPTETNQIAVAETAARTQAVQGAAGSTQTHQVAATAADLHVALGGTAGQDLPTENVHQKRAQRQWQVWEIGAVAALVVAVVAGMMIWLKPWEMIWRGQDEKKIVMAGALANELSQYFNKRGTYPWNYTVGDYVPDQRRPEAAFVYQPGDNRAWLESFLDVSTMAAANQQYWLDHDQMVVLKQVSSGNRVAICFQPKAAKYREAATANCAEDNLGRRDTAYEVNGFDPCATVNGVVPDKKDERQNLYCVASGE